MKFIVKVYKDGQLVQKALRHKKTPFVHILRKYLLAENNISVYLRIEYGKELDVFGRLTQFYNDGEYSAEPDLWQAFCAFVEEE